jgi:hypothetical protein
MADEPAKIERGFLDLFAGVDIDELDKLDRFFHGRKKTVKGKLVIEYPTGEEERAALTVLARLLAAGRLPQYHCILLAELLNPNSTRSRKLALVPRGRGDISGRMALEILHASVTGKKLDAAFTDTADKYGVSRRTIIRAWTEFKKHPRSAEAARRRMEEALLGSAK